MNDKKESVTMCIVKAQYKNEKGISLLEMLLSVMLFSGLMIAVFELLEDYAEKQLARATNDYMQNISLAMQDIISDPVYFGDVYTLADAQAGDVLELTLNDLINGFDTIPPSTRLNASIRERNPLGVDMAFMIRIADNPAIDTDVQALDLLIVTNERVLDERVRRAATIGGAFGGFLREGDTGITNSFAGWELPLIDFVTTNWAAGVAAQPATQEESYLAYYRHLNFDEVGGDYMFRVNIPGRPDLNRMHANLDLNGHNIMGTDNFDVGGNMSLTGQAAIDGNARVNGNIIVNRGDVTAGNRFTTTSAVLTGTSGGGDVTSSFLIDDTLSINQLGTTGEINAQTANFQNGLNSTGDLTTQVLRLQAGVNSAERVQATDLSTNGNSGIVQVHGQASISGLTTQSLNIGSGDVGVIDGNVQGNGVLTGTGTSRSVSVGHVDIGVFGACERGC